MFKSLRQWFRRHTEPKVLIVPAPLAIQLTSRERMEIRDWLALDTTRKVLALMEAKHPGTKTAGLTKHARSEWDQLAAVNFLNQIAGWERYRNTLLLLCEPDVVPTDLSETYPNQ